MKKVKNDKKKANPNIKSTTETNINENASIQVKNMFQNNVVSYIYIIRDY